jgi:hypothetical protein
MTTAAKKSAANKPAAKKATAKVIESEKGPEIVDLPVGTKVPPPEPPYTPHQSPGMGEEMRTANLIAVLALGPDAWRDLYAAGADEDAAETVAQAVVSRLGLSS